MVHEPTGGISYGADSVPATKVSVGESIDTEFS